MAKTPRPRYATVVSTLALLVALGGTAQAANTVRSLDIVDGAVASVDLKNGGVTSSDIKNGTITGVDVANASITGIDIQPGTIGPQQLGYVVLSAQVAADGSLYGGAGAVSALRQSVGSYEVTFGTDLTGCAVTATARLNRGDNAAVVDLGGGTVGALTAMADGTAVDAPFDMIVHCGVTL